jgi:DNA-binding HxlR family transcriptional regulator
MHRTGACFPRPLPPCNHSDNDGNGISMIARSPRRNPPPDDCPLDLCLKFLASAWTTRILWYLGYGPRHFGELRRDLRGISAKMLMQRLRQMEDQGLVARRKLPTKPAQVEYRLTAFGHEFQPVLTAMIKVARGIDSR